jgi:sugar-specific transcriptional regulator TrmB
MSDDNTVTLKEFFKEQIDQLRRDLERHQESMVTQAEYEVTKNQLERSIAQLESTQQVLMHNIEARHNTALEAIERSQNMTILVVGIMLTVVQVIVQVMA